MVATPTLRPGQAMLNRAAVALVLATVVGAAPSDALAGEPGCSKAGRTIASTDQARVFGTPVSGGGRALRGCARAVGKSLVLAPSGEWFPPPAIDLDGTLVAFAQVNTDEVENPLTQIAIFDLARAARTDTVFVSSAARVQGLRLRAPGSLAYLLCFNAGTYRDGNPERRACAEPGRHEKQVLIRPFGGEERLLARSTGIDPLSLRQLGDLVTWRDRGRRRCATFNGVRGC